MLKKETFGNDFHLFLSFPFCMAMCNCDDFGFFENHFAMYDVNFICLAISMHLWFGDSKDFIA